MTTTEYEIQYQFKPNGNWYTDGNLYTKLHLAQIDLMREKVRSKVHKSYFQQRWRIVKREVTEWEEVEA